MKLPVVVFYLNSQRDVLVAKISTAASKPITPIWCFYLQLETKTGKASAASLSPTDVLEAPDLKVALKREREEHQHLLAESYAAVMDLTKQVPALYRQIYFFFTFLVRPKTEPCMLSPRVNVCFSLAVSALRPISFRSERGTGAERSWSCWRGSAKRERSGISG